MKRSILKEDMFINWIVNATKRNYFFLYNPLFLHGSNVEIGK